MLLTSKPLLNVKCKYDLFGVSTEFTWNSIEFIWNQDAECEKSEKITNETFHFLDIIVKNYIYTFSHIHSGEELHS